jgi:hypothetical protein
VPKVGVEPTRLFRTTDFEGGGTSPTIEITGNAESESHETARNDHMPGQWLGNQPAPDPVEAALAVALTAASAAGQWETVAQLARELEARRRARSGTVDLTLERTKRRS